MKRPLSFTRLLCLVGMCSAAEKPNIVFMIADDLGYGDVQCLNP